jgi:hypothetical protein
MPQYKDYNKEDFKTMTNGRYFVLLPKTRKIASEVFIFGGFCFKENLKTRIPSLKNCFLQKRGTLNWDEEAKLEEKIESFVDVQSSSMTSTQEDSPKKKLSDYELRRRYYDNFDKKIRSEKSPKKIYSPSPLAVRTGSIIS